MNLRQDLNQKLIRPCRTLAVDELQMTLLNSLHTLRLLKFIEALGLRPGVALPRLGINFLVTLRIFIKFGMILLEPDPLCLAVGKSKSSILISSAICSSQAILNRSLRVCGAHLGQ